jgi:transposase
MFFWDNIGQEEVCLFIREVLRHLRGKVIALLDNSNTHRGTLIKKLCVEFPRLTLVYFPSYAPELNPDEGVWSWMKSRLANSCPDDLQELAKDLQREFRLLARSQDRLKGCIKQSELPFSIP